jgi:hypothetical protein
MRQPSEFEARYFARWPVHWIKLIDPRWGEQTACGLSPHKKTHDKSAVTCLRCLSILGSLEERKAAQ